VLAFQPVHELKGKTKKDRRAQTVNFENTSIHDIQCTTFQNGRTKPNQQHIYINIFSHAPYWLVLEARFRIKGYLDLVEEFGRFLLFVNCWNSSLPLAGIEPFFVVMVGL